MPSVRSVAVLLSCALCVACGGRTAPIDPEPAADAPDGGFDTFPCRWSYLESVEVAAADAPFTDLQGAVLPESDVALLLGRAGGAATLSGRVLSLPLPASTISEVALPARGAWLALSAGWARVAPGCRVFRHALDGAAVADGEIADARQCMPAQARGTSAQVVALGADDQLVVIDAPLEGGGAPSRTPIPGEGPVDWALAAPAVVGGGFVVALLRGARLSVVRAGGASGGVERVERGEVPDGRVGAAADALRGGIVLLYRDGSGHRLERVDEDLRVSPVATLDGLPSAPQGQVVTNETEALFPLADGSIAFAPLNGSGARVLPPVDEGVGEVRVVLRAGGSAGGALYARGAPDGGELRFVPMVCNR